MGVVQVHLARHLSPLWFHRLEALHAPVWQQDCLATRKAEARTDYVADNPRVDAVALFETWSWGDLWDDANMRSLIRYLYGAKALQIPPNWKSVLPREI